MPAPPCPPGKILECARSIRPSLHNLMSSDAPEMDAQIADLLAQANAGQAVEQQLLDLLFSHHKSKQWAKEFLSQPPISMGGNFSPLPGRGKGQQTIKYVCPQKNDYTERLRPDEDIPECPTCGVPLEPAPKQQS